MHAIACACLEKQPLRNHLHMHGLPGISLHACLSYDACFVSDFCVLLAHVLCRKLTVVSQTNLIYNQTSPVPVNLRLTTPDGAYADFLNPGFVNMQACGYIIHFVSIPLWSPVQTIG